MLTHPKKHIFKNLFIHIYIIKLEKFFGGMNMIYSVKGSEVKRGVEPQADEVWNIPEVVM